MIHQPTRRGILAGLGLLIAAPAVIRVSNLMPEKHIPPEFSMRNLIRYEPLEYPIERVDVMFGWMRVSPEWTISIGGISA